MARLFILTSFMSFLLLAGCGNNKQEDNMAITVNLRYTGTDGNALKFAEEMISSGTVERYTGADMPETDNQFIRH